MRKLLLLASTVSATFALCLLPGAAQAQALQTFVSGTGDDTNLCTRTSPCATWAHAFTQTAAGGEIDALDAGNFGSLTITRAITIDGGGQVAISFPIGGTGFAIAAGFSDVVTLRNLRINGLGQAGDPGVNGILIAQAGMVHIENCNIYGFSRNGVITKNNANTKLVINDTTISDNLNGIQLGQTAGFVLASFDRVRVHNNSNVGIFLNPSGSDLSIFLGMSRSTVTLNGIGLLVEPNGQIVLNDNQIDGNNTGVSVVSGGFVASFANNAIVDNTTGAPFNTISLK